MSEKREHQADDDAVVDKDKYWISLKFRGRIEEASAMVDSGFSLVETWKAVMPEYRLPVKELVEKKGETLPPIQEQAQIDLAALLRDVRSDRRKNQNRKIKNLDF